MSRVCPSPNRARLLWAVGWIAALVPFVWSLAAHAVGPRPQRPAPREKPPALVFDQYLVHLGEVEPTPIVRAWYRFTNHGQQPVRIEELKPSCGCLQPRLEKRVYKPGESGMFFVRVETAGEDPGQKEYFINVRYTDPKPRNTELTFRFTLPERKIVVQPRALIFYQFGRKRTTHEIVVTDYRRPSSLQVLAADCRSPLVTAKVGAPELDSAGNRQVRIAVSVSENVSAGRQQTVLTLETNDRQFPRIHVPLMIVGRAPPVSAVPDRDARGRNVRRTQ